jgi:hypothetical protein
VSEVITLPKRYYPLIPQPDQIAWMNSTKRFNVVPAGRRSGKTERAKRKLARKALEAVDTVWDDPHFFAAGPTRDQAKRMYWADLKAMFIPDMIAEIRESELIIRLVTNVHIHVIGMDKPERVEGSPWDGGILDEYANMKPHAWPNHVRPALSDRRGWCDFIGVPEGRNHYYELYMRGLSGDKADADWASFTWKSAEILPAEEVESARRDLDELVFQQEYEASFVNFVGRVYYQFDFATHAHKDVQYNPNLPLIFAFDFNVAPGVAAVLQEQPELPNGLPGTAVVAEVYIPQGSNTPMVCRKLANMYPNHKHAIYCYGDATGGSSGSAKVQGSDWDLIRASLRPVYGEQLRFAVDSSNPLERARVNAVNSRLKTASGEVRMMVNPEKCKNIIRDLEGVRCVEGGSGEIDKDTDKTMTHLTDAMGVLH